LVHVDLGIARAATQQRLRVVKPWHTAKGFRNLPGMPVRDVPWSTYLRFMLQRTVQDARPVTVPAGHVIPEECALGVLDALADYDTMTWLGHASFLIRLGGATVLTDPFLSNRASPFPFLGPRRFVPPGIARKNLPPIDVVVISHNHYEHLDLRTLARLPRRDRIVAVVPLGLGRSLAKLGYRHVFELDWYEAVTVSGVTITAMPAQHWSQRGVFDANRTLWMGAILESPHHRVYFAGDCGYGPTFAETGRRYGPFDVGLVGIGAYEPRALLAAGHTNPEEAVALARDMRCGQVVGMHWGTIALGSEPPFEAPLRFLRAAAQAGYGDDDAMVFRIGETRILAR
jgi:N-acyl-phosphatidylethanolamine-hydrolysing phospholipase D